MDKKDKKEEKFYTPEEVAIAVLKKAQELLKKSSLIKANTAHEIEIGEEPNNDDAECPPYLAEADIENSGTHGEKKTKKAPKGALAGADKDGDGDIDGDDAIEAEEEITGEDLDGDNEAGEKPEHKAKIDAASKPMPKNDEDKDVDEKISDAAEDKDEKKEDKKKPPFVKSEDVTKASGSEKENKDKALDAHRLLLDNKTYRAHRAIGHSHEKAIDLVNEGRKKYGLSPRKSQITKSEKGCSPEPDLKKPSLKKFMLRRKMKKSGGPTADSRVAEKLSGAPPAPIPQEKVKENPSPAEKVKAQPKLQVEKNKATEKLLGIKPKVGK